MTEHKAEDALRDISRVLFDLHRAFRRINVEPPTVLTLPNHRAGIDLEMALRASPSFFMLTVPGVQRGPERCIEDGGRRWMEMEICGVKIRYPAERCVLPNGRVIDR